MKNNFIVDILEKERILRLHESAGYNTNILIENFSDKVKSVQRALKSSGENLGTSGPNKDGVDGDYGDLTKNAIKSYQRKKRLEDDGAVGPCTAKSLGVEPLVGSGPCKDPNVKLVKSKTDSLKTTDKLKAPAVTFIEPIFKSDDPKQLFVPLNELSNQIYTKHTLDACYWIEWILEYISKKKCVGHARSLCAKHPLDCIWIVWEVFLHYSSKLNETIQKIMKSVLSLFCIRYTPACNERRRFLLYYAISLCCEPISLHVPIVEQKHLIDPIYEKCKVMYKNIKKNEIL